MPDTPVRRSVAPQPQDRPKPQSQARRAPQREIPVVEAKERVLGLIAGGMSVADSMAAVGRKSETYRDWMKKDTEFNAQVASLRSARADAADGVAVRQVPDFPEFCAELGRPLAPHQLQMWDALEGRVPRDLHPAMFHQAGTIWPTRKPALPSGRAIINIPPGHGKTTTFSVMYPVWLIHKDPTVRIIIISKAQGSAVKILRAIKFYLTSPVYRHIHARYAPDGGWKDPDASWTQTQIYVQGQGGDKDPTVEALGIGGTIYGARADVILGDDTVTLSNVAGFEGQHEWLDQEVESRLDGAGLLALLGTRVAPNDLYKDMRDVVDWDDNPVYTYFSMPAILDEGDGTPESWVALWPEQFNGKMLRKIRRNETTWALVYQQQNVAEDATFNAMAVQASINTQRFPGVMSETAPGARANGMAGLYVVGGLDPATTGFTSMIIAGLDRTLEKRYILDGFNVRNCSPQLMRDTIKRFTDLYKINEWVIERNAFQRFLTQDADLQQFFRSRGCKLTETYTTENKYDPDFGIMAMAPMFLTCGTPQANNAGGLWTKTPETALIELPTPRQNAWVGELINQYTIWQPSGMKQGAKTDLVMASWFTEIAIKRILNHGRAVLTHTTNKYASTQRLKSRGSINIAEYKAAQQLEREAV